MEKALAIDPSARGLHIVAENLGDLSRANLASRVVQVLNIGNTRNPDVLLVETGAGVAIVKDFSTRAPWIRRFLGPWLNRREIRAYRALADHPAVPRLLGILDEMAFVVEFRPGRFLRRRLAHEIDPEFLSELDAAIREMHERGVVHLDLRHRTNVLLGEDGHPVLIDFASAICASPGSKIARILTGTLGVIDRYAFSKWRERLTPARS